MTDEQIIQGLRDKDPAAFDSIYERLYAQMRSFATSLMKDPIAAKDLAQEAFVKLWVQKKKFSSISHIEMFLHRVIKNKCISDLRKTRHRTKYENSLIQSGELSENTIERKYLEAEIIQKLYLRINQLPEKMQQVFKLTYLEGYSRAEVAALLNISESTVKNQNYDAMRTLRLAFGKEQLVLIIFLAFFALLSR